MMKDSLKGKTVLLVACVSRAHLIFLNTYISNKSAFFRNPSQENFRHDGLQVT